jgi:hypothetical protein
MLTVSKVNRPLGHAARAVVEAAARLDSYVKFEG